MARRGREDDSRDVNISEAFASTGQKVRLTGIIVEKSPCKPTQGTDYHCSVRIIDPSHHDDCGLLVNFFAESMDNLPQIERLGDIIKLSRVQIKPYSRTVNAVFYKRISAFALYEGKYGQSFAPYHSSPNYHTQEEDKQAVSDLRNWMENVDVVTGSNKFTLREICKAEQFDLICKILHMCEVNQDELMLFVWDGTDVPPCIIQEKLDNEKESPLPLQVEGERLSRDIVSKFPTVGTVLRVKIERGKGKLDSSSSSLIVGRWVKLINLAIEVHAGLWYGVFASCTKYVSDEDNLVLKCLSDFKERFSSHWDRMPYTCLPWLPHLTVTQRVDVAFVTLMDIINHSQVIAKFKCVVRVVAMLPWDPKDFRSPKGTYRIRLTLEDPTARIHAYLYHEDAEKFFDGYLSIEELIQKRNKLLGISSEAGEDGPRRPPWMMCGIKSYYLDELRPRETRTYRVFGIGLI